MNVKMTVKRWKQVRPERMKRLERAWEILCELEQHGHPCDCDFCNPMWREVYKMEVAQIRKKNNE